MIVYGSPQDEINPRKIGDLRSLVEGPRRMGHAWRMLQEEAGKGSSSSCPMLLTLSRLQARLGHALNLFVGGWPPVSQGTCGALSALAPATLPVQQIPSSLLTAAITFPAPTPSRS